MTMLNEFLDAATTAARLAGAYQRYRFSSPFTIEMKGDKDLVTEVDKESERLIVESLLSSFPEHNILAEEGRYRETGSPFRWIIDPIDGTTNFAHGFPWFCSSIALEDHDGLAVGVIYNPIYDETFTAVRGEGAFLNGCRLQVSASSPLRDTLLGTGFPYDCASDPANNFNNFIAFQKQARGIRRAGAAALDLACVAAGRLDGFWELKLKPWDMAAGVLMVMEAGGTVSGFDGSPFNISTGRVIASNGRIHAEMVALLTETAAGGEQ